MQKNKLITQKYLISQGLYATILHLLTNDLEFFQKRNKSKKSHEHAKNCIDCAINLTQDSNNYQENNNSILNEKHLQNNCISSKKFCKMQRFSPQ